MQHRGGGGTNCFHQIIPTPPSMFVLVSFIGDPCAFIVKLKKSSPRLLLYIYMQYLQQTNPIQPARDDLSAHRKAASIFFSQRTLGFLESLFTEILMKPARDHLRAHRKAASTIACNTKEKNDVTQHDTPESHEYPIVDKKQ